MTAELLVSEVKNNYTVTQTRQSVSNGISIGSAVLAGRTNVTNRQTNKQTDRQTVSNKPLLRCGLIIPSAERPQRMIS